MIRGGGWFYVSSYLRSASRHDYNPTYRSYNFGVRVLAVRP
jgi:formylglycine-generating enzyme required for sulfatase activity